MGDSWRMDHDACERQSHEISELIADRNRQPKGSAAQHKKNSQIRVALKTFSSDLNNLRDDLIRTATRAGIPQREQDRRQAMLDQLITKERKTNDAFKNEGNSSGRGPLLNTSAFADDPWSSPGATSSYSDNADLVGGMRQQQRRMMDEQDEGLDVLSSIIAKQKNMAVDIGNEVDVQNELIDDITDHVDRTDQRLIQETRHIRIVDRKSSTCGLWVAIVFLLVVIVVIVVIPVGKHHL